MFPPRIFAFSSAPRSAARIRPIRGGHGHVAAEDAGGPRRAPAPPCSTTPSSGTLPLVSRKTVGAWRRALIVHSQSPPPQMWPQISLASG